MLNWLKSLFAPPAPAGPQVTLTAIKPDEPILAQDGVRAEGDGWRIDIAAPHSVRLFEVPVSGIEQCLLAYRAQVKCENLKGRAFLELWCRIPGSGEFFSKGLQQPVSGTSDWVSCETPFHLKRGQRPDLLKLNLAVEGTGTVWLRNLQILKTPLAR